MNSKHLRIGVSIAVGTVALAAVALSQAGTSKKKPPPMMMAHTGAKLSVLTPKSGTDVSSNAVSTLVRITNFRVDCRFAGTANRKGIGHYHIELDHSLINMFCGPRASVSMQNVAPGRHTLQFIPAADDHADDMKAAKSVTFVYKPAKPLPTIGPAHFPGKPSITILSPKSGTTVHGDFDLTVAVKNFHVSCALYGKADVTGYGHWHANVDSTTMGMGGMGTMLGMSCAHTFHVSVAGIKPS